MASIKAISIIIASALVSVLGAATPALAQKTSGFYIGGGGFGTFIFQGIGQSAADLVLLGAIPTIALALASVVVFEAATSLAKGRAG